MGTEDIFIMVIIVGGVNNMQSKILCSLKFGYIYLGSFGIINI